MSQRKFGVEIEHISKFSHSEMVDELKRFGLVVDDYATGHTRCPNGCYSGWQVKTDGSITVQGEYEYGIELVSPPLGLNSLGELKAALGIADKYGAVNSSCGLHVHVHAPELYAPRNNMKSLDRIITEWGKVEQTIFSYMPLSRRGNANCKSGINTSDRYQALNLDPLFSSRHTIEFRAHSASLNYDKISSWVILCIKFVNRLVTDKLLEQIDPKTILTVQPKIIKPKDGTMFYLHRPQPNWIIEADKKQHKFGDLKLAWDKLREPLKLPGLGYLPDFRFPLYGNAMTQLCHELDIRGMFRSYLEDRYDRVTKKFGFYDSTQNITTLFGEDEDDFYREPDYVSESRP
jgi:hypothetical protein